MLERNAEQKRELALRPAINIGDLHLTSLALRITRPVSANFLQGTTETVSARLLVLRVGPSNAPAFKLKLGGTTTPDLPENSMMSYGWLVRRRHLADEIVVSTPLTDKIAFEQIAASIAENALQTELDLTPGLHSPAVIGFTIKDSSLICIGEEIIDMPYEGRISVLAFNETYGVLALQWFEIKARSWDKVEFPPEAP